MNDTTNTTNGNGIKLSYKAMKIAIEMLRDMKDPIADRMREYGYDPDKGGRLVMSKEMAINIFAFSSVPDYVIINDLAMAHLNHPTLINTYEHLFDVKHFKPIIFKEKSNVGKEKK